MSRLRRWLPELLLGWIPTWQEREQRRMARARVARLRRFGVRGRR